MSASFRLLSSAPSLRDGNSRAIICDHVVRPSIISVKTVPVVICTLALALAAGGVAVWPAVARRVPGTMASAGPDKPDATRVVDLERALALLQRRVNDLEAVPAQGPSQSSVAAGPPSLLPSSEEVPYPTVPASPAQKNEYMAEMRLLFQNRFLEQGPTSQWAQAKEGELRASLSGCRYGRLGSVVCRARICRAQIEYTSAEDSARFLEEVQGRPGLVGTQFAIIPVDDSRMRFELYVEPVPPLPAPK
jgi:hypothetical protein